MRKSKIYTQVTKRIYRTEMSQCPMCGAGLKRYATVSTRTVITLEGPIRVIHCGYRCSDGACSTRLRSYRSAAADALALPGFTFGLDIIVLIGQLRLAQHKTLDETHQAVQARLGAYELSISRREVLYLFDAYCTLVRSAKDWTTDSAWQGTVKANGGIILSIDGIQPDKGNETVYLVRDVLSGRVLAAENLSFSSTEAIVALLKPIQTHPLTVLGAISDAQTSLVEAIAQLWSASPHQVCQFHYLREASRPMYELDRHVRKEMRKAIQQPLRQLRDQIAHQQAKEKLETGEAEQLAVLVDYALGIQTALNLEGQQPFRYASLSVADALSEVASSLAGLEKTRVLSAATAPPNWLA